MKKPERGSAAAHGARWLLLLAAAVGCTNRRSSRGVAEKLLVEAYGLALAADGTGLVVTIDTRHDGSGDRISEILFDGAATSGEWFGAPTLIPSGDLSVARLARVVAGPQRRAKLLVVAGDGTEFPNLTALTRTAAGWGDATFLGDLAETEGFVLAGDGEGAALAAWVEPDGSLVAAAAAPDLGFGVPQRLYDGAFGPARSVSVTLQRNGGAVAAVIPDGDDGDVQLFAFDAALGFVDLGPAEAGATSGTQGAPHYVDVAIGPTGERAVTWTIDTDDADVERVFVRRHAPGSGWQVHERISDVGSFSSDRALDYHDDGRLALAWTDVEDYELHWSRSAAIDTWEPTVTTSYPLPLPGTWELGCQFERDGALTVVYVTDQTIDGPEVTGTRETAAGVLSGTLDLGGVIQLSPGLHDLQTASGGDAVVATWIVGYDIEPRLEAFVWLPPHPDFAVEPAVPEPGVPALIDGLASQPRGSSPARLLEWEFDVDGDGNYQRTLPELFHTFATEGIHEVGVRVTDEWGRVATAVKEVRVEAGGGGGPDVDPPWELVVTVTGNGAVTSDLDSDQDGAPDIDCPADCEESYADGAVVYLTPRPAAGHHFVRWEGLSTAFFDGDYGEEGCLVQMKADRAITAVFAAD